ncbi:RNA polymerase factor sigma-54 [Bradyrhizobium mercantei]|uniref:RNA polymerase factor sigma-54 n=1 Tax=Bradyrhizobium mercantei TaxID=1904807 RepID=UPI0013566902|nr:hypothetical protein [Bradyrhizobium mercantei]
MANTISFAEMLAWPTPTYLENLVRSAVNSFVLRLSFLLDDEAVAKRAPFLRRVGHHAFKDDAGTEGSLYAHVLPQVQFLVKDRSLHRVAMAWLTALEPTGWVACTVDDIAAEAGEDANTALAVLQLLQQAEPAGLFARSLRECLELQLKSEGMLTPPMAAVTAHLEYLAVGRLADLAAAAGVPMAELPLLIGRLRGLNPKPGTAFGAGPIPIRSADLILHFDKKTGWVLERGTWLQPKLAITHPEGRAAARAASAASATLRSFERRDRVIADVARCVFDLQSDFMRGIRSAPVAVTRRQVATALGLHETTVGRVRQHLIVRLENRCLRLSDLFFDGISTSGGNQVSVHEVKARIAELIGRDEKATDATLAGLLSAEGYRIARRTVAKYRAALQLPSSQKRKKPSQSR